jgi:hypothetical protein
MNGEGAIEGSITLTPSALAEVLLDPLKIRWRCFDNPSFRRITLHQSIDSA